MKNDKEFFNKNKYILALVMTLIITTILANSKENKKYNFLENSTAISNNSNKDDNTISNLCIARAGEEMYLLFCPENRGLCVNYETEEFMFMYRSREALLNNLKEYFSVNVEIESFKPYLIENYGDKESYNDDEIFSTFNKLKNNNKVLVKSK